jgi:hypothetical protein
MISSFHLQKSFSGFFFIINISSASSSLRSIGEALESREKEIFS